MTEKRLRTSIRTRNTPRGGACLGKTGLTFRGDLKRSASLATVFLLGSPILVGCARAQTRSSVVYLDDFGQAAITSPSGALSTFFVPPSTSTYSNYASRPRGFGSGAAGERYHYGVSLADDINGKFLRNLIIPMISKERDIYVTDRQGGFFQRLMRASRHSLFSDSTKFNWSSLPGSAVTAAVSNFYQPPAQKTWAATLKRTGTNSLGYWAGDVAWEFDVTCKARRCLKPFHLNCKHPSEH